MIVTPAGKLTVPVVSTADLVERVKVTLKATRVDPRYADWRFCEDLQSGVGGDFEFLTYRPTEDLSAEDIRQHFRVLGFYGHPAAFMAWLIEQKPQGYRASFPEDGSCTRSDEDRLLAPSFHDCAGGITLSLHPLHVILDRGGEYVAFRQVSSEGIPLNYPHLPPAL